MNLEIYATYAEANESLMLPRGRGTYNDLQPIPALDPDKNPEQYSCVIYIRKWSYDGHAHPPDFSFIGLECAEHLTDGYKTDIFIMRRIDGADSRN